MLLQDKIILITGAGQGIGRGIALAAAEEGAKLVVTDLNIETVTETSRLVERLGRPALPLMLDVTNKKNVKSAVETAVYEFGHLDGLVNNAGIAISGDSLNVTEQDIDSQFRVNVYGLFYCCQVAAQQMITQGSRGSIVNIASNAGKVGFPENAIYGATKAAVINLTRILSAEWAKYNINVNAVCPGAVETPMLLNVAKSIADQTSGDVNAVFNMLTPKQLGRHIQPLEVGHIVSFLLSDSSLIIRGQSINIDAGETPY